MPWVLAQLPLQPWVNTHISGMCLTGLFRQFAAHGRAVVLSLFLCAVIFTQGSDPGGGPSMLFLYNYLLVTQQCLLVGMGALPREDHSNMVQGPSTG